MSAFSAPMRSMILRWRAVFVGSRDGVWLPPAAEDRGRGCRDLSVCGLQSLMTSNLRW
jgi:hypothetical protein